MTSREDNTEAEKEFHKWSQAENNERRDETPGLSCHSQCCQEAAAAAASGTWQVAAAATECGASKGERGGQLCELRNDGNPVASATPASH